ncbi:hypothetical protein BOX15_Mlig004480g4 [Macrostomum lignano]|uniref:FLYWCH-type domain-containing protein n=1 Tax=Macrostomum lignano TaxID=282301 RepID=A0A267GL29_9PLAT|nr:hypothetical protein BOX15_Mlig004480g4 [Macrostomum lignano]
MEPIEGKRIGSVGYTHGVCIYQKDRVRNGTVSYRCTNKNCPGRAVEKDGVLRLIAHNHDGDSKEKEILRLRANLKRKAGESSSSLRDLFDRETQASSVGNRIGFAEVESSMYRQRRCLLPPLPKAAVDAYAAICDAPDRFRCVNSVIIIQGGVSSADDGHGLIFAHPDMLSRLSQATFRTVPNIFWSKGF